MLKILIDNIGFTYCNFVNGHFFMNKNKPYDSVLVANYLLALANEKGIILNTTKVQKLLYMAYGFLLAD